MELTGSNTKMDWLGHKNFADIFCKKHVQIDGVEAYQCPNCSSSFQVLGDYQAHLRSHLPTCHPYECEECQECFSWPSSLQKHLKTHVSSKRFSCPQCSEKFSNPFGLNRHNLTHFDGPPYSCFSCNAYFPTVAVRSMHLKNHVISCGLCRIPFQSHIQLRDHISEMHRSENIKDKRKFIDPVEEDPYETSDDENVGDANQNFQCFVCNQWFATSDSYNVHLAAHELFMCSYCPKFFAVEASLQAHEFQHTGHPYKCEECGSILSDADELQLHQESCVKESNPQIPYPSEEAYTNIMTTVSNLGNISNDKKNEIEKFLKGLFYGTLDCSVESRQAFPESRSYNVLKGLEVVNKRNIYTTKHEVQVIQDSLVQQLDLFSTPFLNLNINSHFIWLTEFVQRVQFENYPLEDKIFKKIMHIHKIICEALHHPTGELLKPEKSYYLLNVQNQLADMLTKNLKYTCDKLP